MVEITSVQSKAPKRIGSVVVLYHPDSEWISRLRTYCDFVSEAWVLDNSPQPRSLVSIEGLPARVNYYWCGGNLGLAKALNLGRGFLAKSGCEWMLSMDQDSFFPPGHAEKWVHCASEVADEVALLAPRLLLEPETGTDASVELTERQIPNQETWEKREVAMNSGSLIRMAALDKVGGFDETLFVDYVDYDICLKLNQSGWKVLGARTIGLMHRLGALRQTKWLGFDWRPTHHSALRRYYITRNRLEIMRRYPSFLMTDAWAWGKEVIKMILFEDDLRSKCIAMAKGILHFVLRRFGTLEQASHAEGHKGIS